MNDILYLTKLTYKIGHDFGHTCKRYYMRLKGKLYTLCYGIEVD